MTTQELTIKDITALIPELFAVMATSYQQMFRVTPDDEIKTQMLKEFKESLRFETGKVYIKLIAGYSVYGFIVISQTDKQFKFGDLLKAKSWQAPERNFRRGNIFQLSKGGVNWHGIG